MKDTFLLYRKYGSEMIRINFVLSLIYLLVTWFLILPSLNSLTAAFGYGDWLIQIFKEHFNYSNLPLLIPINAIFFGLHSVLILRIIRMDSSSELNLSHRIKPSWLMVATVFNLLLFAIGYYSSGWEFIITFFVNPFFILVLFIFMTKGTGEFSKSIVLTRDILKGNMKFLYGLSFMIFMIAMLGYFFMSSPFPFIYMEFVQWNVIVDIETMDAIVIMLSSFFSMFTTLITIPVFLIGITLTSFSLREINFADALKKKLADL